MKTRLILVLSVLLSFAFSCKNDNSKEVVKETPEIRQWNPEDTRPLTAVTVKRGLTLKTDEATPGYVLFHPSASTKTYLMDLDGNIVHSWTGELNCMNSYLLENGNLVRMERDIDFPTFAAGGQSGIIAEYDWDGNKVWEFKLANEKELIHHDIEIMPNGNILAICYDAKTVEEAIEAGINPKGLGKAGIWPDKILEIKPIRPYGGEIVWEWKTWDHLIQDIDSTKANYGVVADNPRKINLNAVIHENPQLMTKEQIEQMKQIGQTTSNATVDNQNSDISHFNAVSYNPELDQIVFSSPHLNEIYIIDHSTSIEEAKGGTGGKYGHGGDLLYRWGNQANYGRGTADDQVLFGQHDIKWIPKGYEGEGHLLVFNNDIPNPNNKLQGIGAALQQAQSPDPQVAVGDFGNYSAVHEFVPPTNSDGSYIIPESDPIGPPEALWTYMAPDKYSMYSAFISGAQRIKNGNTLITSGAVGQFIEVTPENKIVWEYWNPYNDHYTLPDGSPAQPAGPFLYHQFRATHYGQDFPAFNDKELKPISPQPEAFIFKMPPPPPVANNNVQ